MSRKLFGTDGVRGVANIDLTPELAFSIGRAAGNWLNKQNASPRAVIGRDTRRSGPMLGAACASGLCSVGVDVVTLGVAPTPAVSYVARTQDFGLGVVVSASHNPAPDNGIKLLGHDGTKLPDQSETEIEKFIDGELGSRPSGASVGTLASDSSPMDLYEDHLADLVPEGCEGLRIAVDGAHGAAYSIAPRLFSRLGAKVVATGDRPDGMNINSEGGATKPETIQKLTVESGASIGVAFDGDADRAIFSDEKGRLINGDRTMGAWCAHWKRQGKLEPSVAVGTVMSNMGFERFLEVQGIRLERAQVGDKHVAQLIASTGAKIGGEQSGHIIFPEIGPTGDGIVTALELFQVLKREGRPASSFYDDFAPWPQILINLSVSNKEHWDQGAKTKCAIEDAMRRLDGQGRLSVRPSGTQPMIRLMVEAESYELRDSVADSVLSALAADLGGKVYSRVDLTHALGD